MKTQRLIYSGLIACFCFINFMSCGNDDDGAPPNSFTDARDGNVYRTVTIGDQIWMAENLRYLPGVVGPEAGSTTTPYYYVNNYNGVIVSEAKAFNNYDTYGVLYNWPAAMNGELGSGTNPSGVQGVCPNGWHLPSHMEWSELYLFVGIDASGGKLKETGTNHWLIPNTAATDEFGFVALPGGARLQNPNVFDPPGELGFWWSTRDPSQSTALFFNMFHNDDKLIANALTKALGMSVRCVKD